VDKYFERGLLSVLVPPDFHATARFYAFYNPTADGGRWPLLLPCEPVIRPSGRVH